MKGRLEAATLKLTSLSISADASPYGLFAWPSHAATDRLAMSEELLPIFGHPALREMSDEQRWLLAMLEAVNFFSLNIAGERDLMTGLAQRLYQGRPAFISRYLQRFLDEENAHTAVFARFCLDYGGLIFSDRQLRFPRQFLPGEEEFLFFARILIFEEIAHFYNRRIGADDNVWKLAREINRYHAEDETRHIAFGRLIVEEMWERFSPSWSEEEKRRIGRYLTRYVATVLHSYVNPDVYRTLGLSPDTRGQILRSAHWTALTQESTRRVTRWLTKLGVIGNE